MNDPHDNAHDDKNILGRLRADNDLIAARFAGDTAPDLDGGRSPVAQLPEAVLIGAGDLAAERLMRTLRDALRDIQAAGLDEDRIEEFCSWALHDPRNPNMIGEWSADDSRVLRFSRGQVTAWAGRDLSEEELARLEDALPNSTFPETVGLIVDSFGERASDYPEGSLENKLLRTVERDPWVSPAPGPDGRPSEITDL